MSALTPAEVNRFLSYTSIEPNSGCWLWTMSLGSHGYGQFVASQKLYTAHRLSLELHKGAAPSEDACALHKCHVRSCCNPDHLYWGTQADNAHDRTEAGVARNGRSDLTHCLEGHELTPENTYTTPSSGFRRCRECRRSWERGRPRNRSVKPARALAHEIWGASAPNDAPPVLSAA